MPVRISPHPDVPVRGARTQLPEISKAEDFLKLAPALLVLAGMSVLRTMSLIVGGALVALGGTAVALFL
jgi:hypothetical protein